MGDFCLGLVVRATVFDCDAIASQGSFADAFDLAKFTSHRNTSHKKLRKYRSHDSNNNDNDFSKESVTIVYGYRAKTANKECDERAVGNHNCSKDKQILVVVILYVYLWHFLS